MLTHADRVDFIEVRTESEALYLEDNLIKQYDPEYNRLLKWDNSYIYLKVMKEDFPQLFLTRFRKNDGSTYIWPKNNTGDLRKLMHYLRQVYKYRTMKKTAFNQGTLSSDFYFDLDKWRSIIYQLRRHPDRTPEQWEKALEKKNKQDPAYYSKIRQAIHNGFVIEKSYNEYKKEYDNIIASIKKFFEGNTREVKKQIEQDIANAIKKENFERCINLKHILEQIDLRSEKQHVVFQPKYNGYIASITALESFWIIILVHIVDWKVIDVIRHKKSNSERSYNQIKASLELETNSQFSKRSSSNDEQVLLYSTWLKRLKKSDRHEFTELLDKFIQSFIVSTTFDPEENLTHDLLNTLYTRYQFWHFPYHIECIDISHLSGMAVSGWLSCMKEWLLYKPWYRRYKIKAFEDNKSTTSNDFLSLQEIIVRRFNLQDKKTVKHIWSTTWKTTKLNTSQDFPDVFILDGGKWQLSILYELLKIFPELKNIMKSHTTFVALGKWSARKESAKSSGESETIYYFDKNMNIQSIDLIYDQADRLLTKLRDEAHRFANKYRKQRMSKQWK